MKEKTIYFLFTDTGTHLSRVINYFTKETLNHVSIGFDNSLKEVYSFGRKRPRNPFIGGFVCEDLQSDFLKDSNCAIYNFQLTEAECEGLLRNIKRIEEQKSAYRYNFLGLFGVLLQIKINRKHAYFCSQFVATMLSDTDSFKLSKPLYFITPADIRDQIGMNLVYQGKIGNYEQGNVIALSSMQVKSSFIFLLSKKVKQLVAR